MSKGKNKRIWKISVIEICQRCNWVLLFPYLKWLLDLFNSSVRLFFLLIQISYGIRPSCALFRSPSNGLSFFPCVYMKNDRPCPSLPLSLSSFPPPIPRYLSFSPRQANTIFFLLSFKKTTDFVLFVPYKNGFFLLPRLSACLFVCLSACLFVFRDFLFLVLFHTGHDNRELSLLSSLSPFPLEYAAFISPFLPKNICLCSCNMTPLNGCSSPCVRSVVVVVVAAV